MKILFAVIVSGALVGCATKADQIGASYVSDVAYKNRTCDELAVEAQSISARAVSVAGAQNKQASNDAVAVGVAVVIFWPALFLARGDGQTAAELARLKGEMEAIERVSNTKGCEISFQKSA